VSAARAALALGCALLAACAALHVTPSDPLVSVGTGHLPPFGEDLDPASLREAIERSLPAYTRPADAAAARRLLEIVDTVADPDVRRSAVARAFRVMRVRRPLLLTAYYEPELDGRLTPDQTYRYPLYARPADLVSVDPGTLDPGCTCRPIVGRVEDGRLRPFPTRGEIETGALTGQGLELAWAADPIDVFLLHVQGSGLLRLADGTRLGVRYAGTNGRPYRSLGQTLVERGLLSPGHATLADIRHALQAMPPDEQQALLASNERYTFFRFAAGGPVGSLGVELTPGRSVATDPRLVPPGTLAYLATPSVHRFVVSQDVGTAVQGAHADLFLGSGADAGERAGALREHGALYLLLPR
jgi:membrane-bound lytic murein transglycosylase A